MAGLIENKPKLDYVVIRPHPDATEDRRVTEYWCTECGQTWPPNKRFQAYQHEEEEADSWHSDHFIDRDLETVWVMTDGTTRPYEKRVRERAKYRVWAGIVADRG